MLMMSLMISLASGLPTNAKLLEYFPDEDWTLSQLKNQISIMKAIGVKYRAKMEEEKPELASCAAGKKEGEKGEAKATREKKPRGKGKVKEEAGADGGEETKPAAKKRKRGSGKKAEAEVKEEAASSESCEAEDREKEAIKQEALC